MDSSDTELFPAIQDVLLEFRAGKMHMEGKRVVADPRKGLVRIGRILSSYNAGAKIVKVYPISAIGGVRYIATLKNPFPHIPIVACQGITTDSVGAYIDEGASAVVLSDAIFDKKAISKRNFSAIYHLAQLAALQDQIEPIPAPLEVVIDHLIQFHLISENRRANNCIISFFDEANLPSKITWSYRELKVSIGHCKCSFLYLFPSWPPTATSLWVLIYPQLWLKWFFCLLPHTINGCWMVGFTSWIRLLAIWN